MKRLAYTAVVISLLLAGCSSDKLSGTVVEKTYEPSRTSTSTGLVCGKTCQPVVTTNTTPECFRLVVENADGVDTDCVDEARWILAKVGEQYQGEDVE